MKARASLCLAALVGLFSVANAENWDGKTEAEMIAAKGHPIAKTVAGKKKIYRWDDSEVTFENGRVSKVMMRNLKKEAELKRDARDAALDRKAEAEAKKRRDARTNADYMRNAEWERANAANLELEQKKLKERAEREEKNRAAEALAQSNRQQNFNQAQANRNQQIKTIFGK